MCDLYVCPGPGASEAISHVRVIDRTGCCSVGRNVEQMRVDELEREVHQGGMVIEIVFL